MVEDVLKSIRILYVEDEDAIRLALHKILSRYCKEVYTANNGVEGLKLFNEKTPDIIISDIRMPLMDGLEMIENIRAADQSIPVIITTGHNDEEFLLRSIDLSVDKYIKKPIVKDYLVSSIQRIAQSLIQQRAIEAQREFIDIILDTSPDLIMITDGNDISYINQAMIAFSGCSGLDDFRNGICSIDMMMVHKEGFFYQDRPFKEWIGDVIGMPNMEYKVLMNFPKKPTSSGRIFLLRSRHVPQVLIANSYLLTFSDITVVESERQLYYELAMTDPLTGIYNRIKFFDALREESLRSKRYGRKLSLIIFDIDFFKNVNDTYGHPVGDYILKTVTAIVKDSVREVDVFARYGGEEFVLLLPETDVKSAHDKADKLRKSIEVYKFKHLEKNLTCSFGVSEKLDDEKIEDLIRKADSALYMAKHQGRNQVCTLLNCDEICQHVKVTQV